MKKKICYCITLIFLILVSVSLTVFNLLFFIRNSCLNVDFVISLVSLMAALICCILHNKVIFRWVCYKVVPLHEDSEIAGLPFEKKDYKGLKIITVAFFLMTIMLQIVVIFTR